MLGYFEHNFKLATEIHYVKHNRIPCLNEMKLGGVSYPADYEIEDSLFLFLQIAIAYTV